MTTVPVDLDDLLMTLRAQARALERLTALLGPEARTAEDAASAATDAVAMQPAQAPNAAPARRVSWTSPERNAALRRLYPGGTPWPAIMAELAKLPGGPLPPHHKRVGIYACTTLKLKRPEGSLPPQFRAPTLPTATTDAAPQAITAASPPPPPAFALPTGTPGVALPPVPQPWADIVAEAVRDGHEVRSRDDLPGWNRSRIARGLAPLCIKVPKPVASAPRGLLAGSSR